MLRTTPTDSSSPSPPRPPRSLPHVQGAPALLSLTPRSRGLASRPRLTHGTSASQTECRAKSIELQLVVGSSLARLGPSAKVFADPTRLTQILVNLLSNAIRFTAKSDKRVVTLTVEVSAQPPERDSPLIPPAETEYKIDKQKPVYLFFSVEDTGPGMSEEETGRLFAKFMQCVVSPSSALALSPLHFLNSGCRACR